MVTATASATAASSYLSNFTAASMSPTPASAAGLISHTNATPLVLDDHESVITTSLPLSQSTLQKGQKISLIADIGGATELISMVFSSYFFPPTSQTHPISRPYIEGNRIQSGSAMLAIPLDSIRYLVPYTGVHKHSSADEILAGAVIEGSQLIEETVNRYLERNNGIYLEWPEDNVACRELDKKTKNDHSAAKAVVRRPHRIEQPTVNLYCNMVFQKTVKIGGESYIRGVCLPERRNWVQIPVRKVTTLIGLPRDPSLRPIPLPPDPFEPVAVVEKASATPRSLDKPTSCSDGCIIS